MVKVHYNVSEERLIEFVISESVNVRKEDIQQFEAEFSVLINKYQGRYDAIR